MVGYSRLMGAHEHDTLAAFRRHRRDILNPKAVHRKGIAETQRYRIGNCPAPTSGLMGGKSEADIIMGSALREAYGIRKPRKLSEFGSMPTT